MRVKSYMVIDDCIERGVNIGYARAFKHTDTPTEDEIKASIVGHIQSELDEYFDYD